MCSLAMCDFSGDGNLEVKYVNIAVPSFLVSLLFYLTLHCIQPEKGCIVVMCPFLL